MSKISAELDEASKVKSQLDQSPFSFDRMAYERISQPARTGEIVTCGELMSVYRSQGVAKICQLGKSAKVSRIVPGAEDISRGYYGSCVATFPSLASILGRLRDDSSRGPASMSDGREFQSDDIALSGQFIEIILPDGVILLQFEGPKLCLLAITSINTFGDE